MNFDRTMIHPYTCWARLGWYDIVSRYRQTKLGPFWITLLTMVIVVSLGVVYASLFAIPISDFLPYVSAGLVFWGWLSSTFLEASSSLQSYKHLLLNHKISPILVLMRVFVRNFIILFHNIMVVFVVLIYFKKDVSLDIFYILPGLLVNCVFIFSISILLALICSRYRDLVQALNALMNIGMLITPVIWSPEILSERAYIAYLNPFTHVLALVREPLLGHTPTNESWLVVIICSILFSFLSYTYMKKYRYKLLFWI